MKVHYVEARYKGDIILPDRLIKALPKKVAMFSSVQFLGCIESVKEQLKKNKIKTITFKTRHTMHDAQLLGCNLDEYPGDYDAFLYIGDGLFHPYALIIKNNKPAYLYNPFDNKYDLITQKDTDKWLKQKKVAYVKFLHADNIGVLITTKPGQSSMRLSFQLTKLFPEKNFYYFLDNTFNYPSLEDFPFIEVFVNTACPRIPYEDYDKFPKPIINMEDLAKELLF